jgi:hypothetical protein
MNETVSQVLKAVGLAMGVAVVVLSILNAGTTDTYVMLLGIGLFALGLNALSEGVS